MRHILCALAVLSVCSADAQSGKVSGRVFDPTCAVIPTAAVSIGAGATTITNSEGWYSIGGLSPGAYTLTVSAPGFATQSAVVQVPAGSVQRDVTLAIAPTTERLVVAEKAPRAENTVESWTDNIHASVDVREIRESGARDAGEALAAMDGLTKIRKGGIANDVLMRGLGHDNINVLVDGARIHGACPSGMDPRTYHVDFAEVERVEVTKGVFDLLNQGSLGGAVNIVTKEPGSGLHVTPNLTAGSFGFYNPSLIASYSTEKVWGMAGYSFRASEPYRDGSGRRFTDLANYAAGSDSLDAFSVHTGWFRFGWETGPGERAKLSYTRQASGSVLYPYLMMDAGYDNADRIAVAWEAARAGSIQHIRVNAYASRVKHWMTDELRQSASGTPPGFSMASFAESAAFGGKAEIDSGGLIAGVEAYRRKWDGTSVTRSMMVYTAQHFIPAPVSDISGAYAQYRKALSPRLHVTAATRLDGAATRVHGTDAGTDLYWAYKLTRSTAAADIMPSASAWAGWSAGPLEFFAGAGSTARIPDPVERYIASQRMGSDFVGNPTLRPTRNTEADSGFTWRTRRFLLRPTLFYSAISDFVTVQDQARIVPGGPMSNRVARSYANVDVRSYGGELNYTLALDRRALLSGGVSYARSIKDAAPQLGIFDRNVAEIPPLRTHTTLRYGSRLLFAETTFTAVAAQRRVDRELQESATPGYAVLDFKGGIHTKKLNFALGLANALDRLYYDHCSYQRDPFRSGLRVPEPGRNVFVTLQYAF